MRARYFQTPKLRRRNRLIYAYYEAIRGTVSNPVQRTAQDLALRYYQVDEAIRSEREEITFEIEEAVDYFQRQKRKAA